MTLSILILQITVISVLEEYKESSVKFVMAVESLRQGKPLYFFKLGPDGEELKYLVNLPPQQRFIPQFIFPSGKYGDATFTKRPAGISHKPLTTSAKVLATIIDYLPANNGQNSHLLKPKYICYNDWNKLFSLPSGTIFITSNREFRRSIPDKLKVKIKIIATGKLGHRKCLAFVLIR